MIYCVKKKFDYKDITLAFFTNKALAKRYCRRENATLADDGKAYIVSYEVNPEPRPLPNYYHVIGETDEDGKFSSNMVKIYEPVVAPEPIYFSATKNSDENSWTLHRFEGTIKAVPGEKKWELRERAIREAKKQFNQSHR